MPLPMVHLSTAVKVNTLKDAKSPEYYLGSISPDAVHMRANYVSEDKVVSHCNARTMEAIGELDALCAIADISSGKEREFLLGYLVHILTDLYWADTVRKMHQKRYDADPEPVEDSRMAYYNDTDQLDFVIYEKAYWRPTIWEMLAQAEDFAVAGAVHKEEVAAWKH